VHLVGFHYTKSCASLNFVYIIPNITFREYVLVGLSSLVNCLPLPGTRTYSRGAMQVLSMLFSKTSHTGQLVCSSRPVASVRAAHDVNNLC
jgi:hypothetical protein